MAIVLAKSFPDGGRLAVWKIEESLEELIALSFNPDNLRQAVSSKLLEKRKLELVATRLLLQVLTGEFVQVEYLSSGKPYLADNRFRISLSHTDGYAAAFIHPDQDPGIDIEYISTRVMRIQNRFLSQPEIAALQPDDPLTQTLILWSAKESAFKALDKEGVDFREQLVSDPFTLRAEGIFKIQELRTEEQIIFPIQYWVNGEYVLTATVGEGIYKIPASRQV